MGDRSYLLDLFAQYGPIRIKRMFGAEGLFDGDLMFGFADDDVIYLKTDESTRPAFAAEGCKPFIYRKHTGEEIEMSYWRIPDRLYDDPEELAQWARKAFAVASRSPTAERKRKAAVAKSKNKMSSPAERSPKARARGRATVLMGYAGLKSALSRIMALRAMRSFLATAMRASFLAFPAFTRVS